MNNNQNNNEGIILLNSLKSGLSTRQLDSLLGLDTKQSKGFVSWKILKKYGINESDKGILFVYSSQQAKALIKYIVNERKNVNDLIKQYPPETISAYKNSYMITENAKSLYGIMKGESRNIVQGFFSPLKKIIHTCQFNGCNRTDLETAHLEKDRPQLFIEAANESKPIRYDSNSLKFDIYEVMRRYLEKHRGKCVCFLCKKHHVALDKQRTVNKKVFLQHIKSINIK